MRLSKSSVNSSYKFKMKKVSLLLLLEEITVKNLKMKTFEYFAKVMVLTITFLLKEHFNIDLC